MTRPPPARRPARRLPARVYWFRRLLVIGVATLLVWGVAGLVGGAGDGSRSAAAGESTPPTSASTPSATTATTPADPQDAGSGPRGHQPDGHDPQRPHVVTTALPDAQGGCLPADVTVTPTVEPGAVSGTDVPIDLSLATTGDLPCRVQIDAALLTVQVSSDGHSVWDTEQCPSAVPERTVVLRPGWASALVVVWPGLVGDKGCTGETRPAPPGAYSVESAVYEGEPSQVDVGLRAAGSTTPDGQQPTHESRAESTTGGAGQT